MPKYLLDPDGKKLQRVPERGWLKLPNGDHVAAPAAGYVSNDGYTVIYEEPVEPVEVPPTPAEVARNQPVKVMNLLNVLYQRGLLDAVGDEARKGGGITEVFFNRSSEWMREGTHEKYLLGALKVSGDFLTEDEIDHIFAAALS